jgi:hypothetical protein
MRVGSRRARSATILMILPELCRMMKYVSLFIGGQGLNISITQVGLPSGFA